MAVAGELALFAEEEGASDNIIRGQSTDLLERHDSLVGFQRAQRGLMKAWVA